MSFKPFHVFFALVSLAGMLSAQVTGRLQGTVKDPQGSAIPNAKIEVSNPETGQRFSLIANENGEWLAPSLDAATYRVTLVAPGFKTSNFPKVVIEASVVATLNATLEIGAVAETVEVSAGAEMLQTATASVTSTLTGRQISELPYTSRNAMDIVTSQPGTSTPGTPRTSSINGLPKGSLNLSIDGVNIQDNYLKSSDGYFATIQPKSDTVEEVVITTAGAGAESTGEGAAQVRFVTKSGTNEFHGGAHWQHRNTDLNSNYYFNTINGLARDRIILNQVNGRLGGPIWKNKAFFFFSWEEFRLPQTYGSPVQTYLTNSARSGLYTYIDSVTKQPRSVNLYSLAAAGNAALPAGTRPFATTPDPVVAGQLALISQLTAASGSSKPNSATDFNRNQYTFQTPGNSIRHFPTMRLDANLTQKIHWEFIGNYQKYYANPDAVNGILPIYPGTGTVLGNDASGGTRRISFSGVTAVRATITNNLTSEIRFGITGGDSIFREEITPALFSQTGGYATSYGFTTNPYNATGGSRRNSPTKNLTGNLSWLHGKHVANFGGSFTQINLWQSSFSSQLIPVATFGLATGDPVNTGATSIFTAANLPNSTSTNLSEAASLYALLTGRISSITRSAALDETSKSYAYTSSIDRNQEREFAFYGQDSWRVLPSLTINAGVRWEVQLPLHNLSGIYTRPTYAGLFGISGTGNLFKPGSTGGSAPVFTPIAPDTAPYKTYWNNFLPSLGLAYTPPGASSGPMHWLVGDPGKTVLRAAYSISSIREGTALFDSLLGSNQGRSLSLTVDPSNFPAQFGAPGSVLFRDAVLPSRTFSATPSFPIAAVAGNSLNDFDPNLRLAYVQSWNLSVQREIAKNTKLDVRYVGNHSVGQWRQFNLNEVNIFENGFLDEFKAAANNLAINRASTGNAAGTDFGNHNLPGQKAIPIISTALALTSDTTTATQLSQGQAGALASAIALNAARMTRLTGAGYPANLFIVNPTVLNGGSFVIANSGSSSYNGLQTEVTRRMSSGLELQGSYVWSKSLTNMDASSSSVFNQPTTLRNTGYDKGPSPWDIRHAFKTTFIYELPIGPGRSFLANVHNRFANGVLGGWEIAGVTRIQAGSPELLRSGRQTVNTASGQSSAADAGVVLHNITASQLQGMVDVRKDPSGVVTFLPQALLNNSYAAFEINGKTLKDLDPNAPYIGPPTTPGEFGDRIYVRGPWQERFDLSVVKRFKIGEKKSIEFRTQFLNAFNNTNFLLGAAGNDVNTGAITATSPLFGQINNGYRDITVSGTNDPGGRLIEFALRINF